MFNLTANHANDRYLTADLGGDTTNVKLLICPDYVAGTHYVMIDHKSAMKLANPKKPASGFRNSERDYDSTTARLSSGAPHLNPARVR